MMARTKISPFLEAEPPSEVSKYADALADTSIVA
jgi:hypothetical protein